MGEQSKRWENLEGIPLGIASEGEKERKFKKYMGNTTNQTWLKIKM